MLTPRGPARRQAPLPGGAGRSGGVVGGRGVEVEDALVERLKSIPGKRHVCLEEGTQSGWLHEILSPHAERVVVVAVMESRRPKSDAMDAFGLAEKLRTGTIETAVYKGGSQFFRLRELARVHAMVVRDVVRAQNRIKSLYRSRGIAAKGKPAYSTSGRTAYLEKLPEATRSAAETLYAQYDAVIPIRDQAEKELVAESHRHAVSRTLETCPGLGPIRVARLLPVVVTPGTAVVMGAPAAVNSRVLPMGTARWYQVTFPSQSGKCGLHYRIMLITNGSPVATNVFQNCSGGSGGTPVSCDVAGDVASNYATWESTNSGVQGTQGYPVTFAVQVVSTGSAATCMDYSLVAFTL